MFSLAIGSIFWLSLGASLLALLAVFVIREIPLRSSIGPAVGESGRTATPARPGAEALAPQRVLAGD